MKKNVRILVVEDEFVTLDTICDELEEIGYDISGAAMKAEEAIEILEKKDTDLVLLDIQLKGDKNGIWLGKQIQAKYKIPFIFLTAYSDSKTVKEAAETNPSAYLVKPFQQTDLFTSIEVALKNYARYEQRLNLSNSQSKIEEELVINDAIFIKEKSVFKKLLLDDILYIETIKNYLEIHTVDTAHIIRATMKDFMQLLPKNHFVQSHRSFVVNTNKVDRISGAFLHIGILNVPMSRTHKDDVLAKMKFFY